MTKTSIEWTDHSVNPLRARVNGLGKGHYCEKLSPGCKNCYSSRLQPRLGNPQFQAQRGAVVEHWLDVSKLEEVLRRRAPTKFFWCDMTDMFGDWVPFELVAACFGVMAATPQHTHQVLTKRPKRAAEWFAWYEGTSGAGASPYAAVMQAASVVPGLRGAFDLGKSQPWPLPNVWLGVSSEDQQRADERIPYLLELPAAVRFVSAEPLLGPIDLKGWGDHAPAPVGPEWDSITWDKFAWDEWIPEILREAIRKFWSDAYGRGPASWLRDHRIQQVPRTGARLVFGARGGSTWLTTDKMATNGVEGRYVHMWNNIGRVVTDDGRILFTGGGSGSGWFSHWLTRDGDYRSKLHWIIAGAESGSRARPMEEDWIRSLRDQCTAAGVSFFYKQKLEGRKKVGLPLLDGLQWAEFPEVRA